MSPDSLAALLPHDALVRLGQLTLLLALLLLLDRVGRGRIWPQLLAALWWLIPLRAVLPADLGSPFASLTHEPAQSLHTSQATAPAETSAWLLVWLAGALAVAAFGTLRRLHERRRVLAHATPPANDDPARDALDRSAELVRTRRHVRLLRSPATSGPVVFGTLRPTIVLPTEELPRNTRLRHVLLHELMHVRRHDPLRRTLVGLATALFWFHPLAWLARRRVEELREICCDAAVAARLGDEAGTYRRSLLETAREWLPRDSAALGWMSARHPLLERAHWLEREGWRHPLRRRLTTGLAAVAVVACGMPVVREVAPPRPAVVPTSEVAEARTDPTPSALEAAARATLARAADGEPGCIQARWAAVVLHQSQSRVSAAPDTKETR